MSEEIARSGEETGAPVAVSLALAGASREEADTFLREQRALIELQKHHLHEEIEHLHLDMWEKRLGVWLRAATFCVGIAVATGFGLLVWDAAHSHGLIIEPFAVPADMADRGLTGQAIASQMLDKILTMESATGSNRAPQSYENNWGSDIKVQIPETGVSIGEFRQFLRDWLGHDIHISGEIYHTDTGLAISSRISGQRGASFTGPQTGLDALIQEAAEYVYGNTQPQRYAQFLTLNQNATGDVRIARRAEGLAAFRRLTEGPSRLDRAWAWMSLANMPRGQFDYAGTLPYLRKAISVYPDFPAAYHLSAWFERLLGHPEAALEKYRRSKALFGRSAESQFDPRHVPKMRLDTDLYIAFLLGDYAQAVTLGHRADDVANDFGSEATYETFRNATAISLGLQHDGAQARAFFSEMPELVGAQRSYYVFWRGITRVRMDAALQDWPAIAAEEASAEKNGVFPYPTLDMTKVFRVQLRPWLALAKARTGDIAGGEAVITGSPGDCYDCNLVRGQIAETAKQPGRADYWFARAVSQAPSIPIAYAEWGEVLVARGKPDEAIAQFTIANQKGPHFADPLEGWGEALMAKNQSHLALAKFAEAEKYAPNWGRLHLKWGEALVYAGRGDEAKAQFTRATALDLTPSEKSELARMGR